MSSPIMVSVSSVGDDENFIVTKFDRRTEEASLVDLCAEYIQAGRPVPFFAKYFWDSEPICMLRSGPVGATDNRWRSMFELISVFSTLNHVHCMGLVAFTNNVQVIGGEHRDCVCLVTLARHGSEIALYPYTITEDNKVVFEDITAADDSGDLEYPNFVASSLASYAFAYKGFGMTSEVLEWLSRIGVGVQFFGDWDLSTIDARQAHFPSLDLFLEDKDETEAVPGTSS